MGFSLSHHPLARDIALVLAIKVFFIAMAGVFLFPKDRRPVIGPETVARQLFGYDQANGVRGQ